jgi:hypothetical protein
VIFVRAFARLIVLLVLLALALSGLATAIFAIGYDDSLVSLPKLAAYLQLPEGREVVADWLDALEASGPTAWWSVLGGLLAMLLGLFLLAGLLLPRRERLVIIREDEAGRIAARRRPYAQVAEVLAEQERGVTRAKARVRPSWRGRGGSLKLTATRTPLADEADVERRVGRGVEPLAQAAGLRMQIRSRLGTGRDRVE